MTGQIRISDLRSAAAQRPAGYLDEILAAGRVENEILHIEHAVYSVLRKKYAPKTQPVSLSQKAANITGATFRVAKAVFKGADVIASASEIDRRMAICQSCEFFTGTTCKKCGCLASFKTKLATETCPIGKW